MDFDPESLIFNKEYLTHKNSDNDVDENALNLSRYVIPDLAY